jgi:hypothetical protein
MALYRWPTDPPGKKAAHTISWDDHQKSLIRGGPDGPPPKGIGGQFPLGGGPPKGLGGQVPLGGIQGPPPASIPGIAGPTTPGAPGSLPPGPQGPQPLPVDPIYDDDAAGLLNRRTSDEAGITGARTRGLSEYGFTETNVDPATGVGTLAFDPNNPFSRASLLKRNYDISRTGTGNRMASGGQLYAGAYQTAQDSLNRGQLGAEDTLQKSLIGFLSGNSKAFSDAGTDYNLGMSAAEGRRVQRAPDSPLYSPTSPAPAAPISPSGASGIAPPKAAKPLTLKAGPGVKATKNTTVTKPRKGRTVTYTTSVKGP